MYEWRYIPWGRVKHAIRTAEHCGALCGCTVANPADWRGTGTQDEYERVAALPECKRCRAIIGTREGAPWT